MSKERKYLSAIAIIAIVLTVLMIGYTMIAANTAQSSSSSSAATQAAAAQGGAQSGSADQNAAGGDAVDEKLFPATLAGMNRAKVISGQQAMAAVSQLHGKNISLVRAFVVSYQGSGSQQMTIYYSEANNAADASILFKEMDQKMPKTSAFQNYKTVTVDGKAYKFVTGMGQEHYYWQSGNRILWLAVGAPNSADVLKQVAPLY